MITQIARLRLIPLLVLIACSLSLAQPSAPTDVTIRTKAEVDAYFTLRCENTKWPTSAKDVSISVIQLKEGPAAIAKISISSFNEESETAVIVAASIIGGARNHGAPFGKAIAVVGFAGGTHVVMKLPLEEISALAHAHAKDELAKAFDIFDDSVDWASLREAEDLEKDFPGQAIDSDQTHAIVEEFLKQKAAGKSVVSIPVGTINIYKEQK
jgi:hypothetical protein